MFTFKLFVEAESETREAVVGLCTIVLDNVDVEAVDVEVELALVMLLPLDCCLADGIAAETAGLASLEGALRPDGLLLDV